jgi:3-methyladenine DNA glycosylase AlkD
MKIRNIHHKNLLAEVKRTAGRPAQDKFLNRYLGADRPRYDIRNPEMRSIVSAWLRANRSLTSAQIASVISSLVQGRSVTEKMTGGFILDRCSADQRKFPPKLYDRWLNHLEGWAEVDTFCAGKYSGKEVPAQWKLWRPLLIALAKSKKISKRRASLVLLCAPLRYSEDRRLAKLAFANITRLRHEDSVLITKAISWLLRSMVKLHRPALVEFLRLHREELPSIAVRETETKIRTGRKTAGRIK